eukprot:507499-Amphidinium_carterae.2
MSTTCAHFNRCMLELACTGDMQIVDEYDRHVGKLLKVFFKSALRRESTRWLHWSVMQRQHMRVIVTHAWLACKVYKKLRQAQMTALSDDQIDKSEQTRGRCIFLTQFPVGP